MGGWVDGGWVDGWVGGWMGWDGWVGGWMGDSTTCLKASLRRRLSQLLLL